MLVGHLSHVCLLTKGYGFIFRGNNLFIFIYASHLTAELRSAVGRAPDSQVRGHGFDTRSGHIGLFLLTCGQLLKKIICS